MVTVQDINDVYKKTSKAITTTVKDKDGNVWDLTGYTAYFTVKKKGEDADASAVIGPKTMTIAAPATGVISVTLSTTETNIDPAVYQYQILIAKNSTSTDVVNEGKFKVNYNLKAT